MSFIHRAFLGILAAGLACGPDAGGLSSSGEGSGSTGTEGSTSSSTTTSTTMSATASTVATSDADGTTTAPATSGPMDTTAEGSSGAPGTDSSSSGNPPPPAYPACDPAGEACPDPYTFCAAPMMGDRGSWCTFECMDAAECPVPDSGSAEVSCGGPPMQPTRCQLDCSMGDCPDGMDCVGLGPMGQALRCVWPPPP